MAKRTYLDELVDYPAIVISRLSAQQEVVDLLADKNGANVSDLLDQKGNWKAFYDYEYIPGTTQEVMAAVCVDTDVVSVPTSAQKTMELYVSVLCSQAIMPLDRSKFKDMRGNRLDNLIRYIDFALRLDRDFGIGRLELKNARTTTAGNASFAKKTLTYSIPDFNLAG